MLPQKIDPDRTDNRSDYLSLPYNDPIRVKMRALEAALGAMYEKQNAANANAGGLLSGLLTLVGAIAGFVFLGPGGVFVGAAAGAGAGLIADNVIRARFMYPAERQLALKVFGRSLPPYEQIIITDLSGFGGRNFTYPGSTIAGVATVLNPVLLAWLAANPSLFDGKTLVNMGSGFGDAIKFTTGRYMVPGQVLIHELTHAWQIRHDNTLGFICSGVMVQTRDMLGQNVYDAPPGKQWNEYGLEQQATLVDKWFAAGAVENKIDPYFRYIDKNIRTGEKNAQSQGPLVGRLPTMVASSAATSGVLPKISPAIKAMKF